MEIDEMIGKRFGRLTVIEAAESRRRTIDNKLQRFYRCKCECGNTTVVARANLRSGNSKSCGCRKFNGYDGNRTHGLTGTFEYRVWKGMRRRCRDKKLRIYKYYGGRNIKVCKRWNCFEKFLADMGPAPSEKHSIERINVNGNYTPENCEWIEKRKQSINRRTTIKVTFEGQTRTLCGWAEHLGIPVSTLYARHWKGWPVDRMLKQPRKNYALKRS